MTNNILIALGIAHLIAAADIWRSQLTATAKVLWTLVLVFLPVVGIAAWLLTRGSAHRPLDEFPPDAEAVAVGDPTAEPVRE